MRDARELRGSMLDGPGRARRRPASAPIVIACALALAASVAGARTGSAPARAATAEAPKPVPAVPDRSWERTQRATKIIGVDVVNRQGEKVGDIEDIVLDRNGSVAYAVVSTGGFLGVGDRLHAVPWRSLQTDTGTDKFVLDVDKQRLGKAPGFDNNTFPDINQPKWSAENRKHFPLTRSGAEPTASRTGRNEPPSGSGRATGNDVGPTTSTARRSGPAAGSGSAPASAGSTAGTSAGATVAAPGQPGGSAGNPTDRTSANPADPAGGVDNPATTRDGVGGRGQGSGTK